MQIDVEQRSHWIVGIGCKVVDAPALPVHVARLELPHLEVAADVIDQQIGRQAEDAVHAGHVIADEAGRGIGSITAGGDVPRCPASGDAEALARALAVGEAQLYVA